MSKQSISVPNDDKNSTAKIAWTQPSKVMETSALIDSVGGYLCSDTDTCMHLPAVFAPAQYTDSDLLWRAPLPTEKESRRPQGKP